MRFIRGYLPAVLITGLFWNVLLTQSASAVDPNTMPAIRFEAEAGTFAGKYLQVSAEATGYSGQGYLTGFKKDEPNDMSYALVTVFADADQDYPLIIGYRQLFSPTKKNKIFVNGEDLGYWHFPQADNFAEFSHKNIPLKAGTNTVMFANPKGSDGWMDLDYFDIKGLSRQASEPNPKYDPTPDPNASYDVLVLPRIGQLCWKNPDAGYGDYITCDVYLGTSEPDDQLPDYGLEKIASGMWGNCINIPELNPRETYYWIVDCWDYNGGTPLKLRGPTWKFKTGIAPTIVEAEDGYLTGPEVAVAGTIPGYWGTGYVTGFRQIDPANEKVTVAFTAAQAGEYPLSIRYMSPYGKKGQVLYVNGSVEHSQLMFPECQDWQVLECGKIALDKGTNTVAIGTYWGYMHVDSFIFQNLDPAASSPKPAHLSTVGVNLAQLCWNKPEGTVSCDVYFGDNPDLQDDENNYGLELLAQGVAGNCVNINTTLLQSHDYYWVVNCWGSEENSPVLRRGGLWKFSTGNTPPEVNPGPNRQVWLGQGGVPGKVTVTIDATVTDDGLPSGTVTYLWEQTSGPALVPISPNNVEDITLTFTQIGVYGFRLTASDTVLSKRGTVYVAVADTPCHAAMASSAYLPFEGDLDHDCYVSLKDFSILAADWMNCVDPQGCQ